MTGLEVYRTSSRVTLLKYFQLESSKRDVGFQWIKTSNVKRYSLHDTKSSIKSSLSDLNQHSKLQTRNISHTFCSRYFLLISYFDTTTCLSSHLIPSHQNTIKQSCIPFLQFGSANNWHYDVPHGEISGVNVWI